MKPLELINRHRGSAGAVAAAIVVLAVLALWQPWSGDGKSAGALRTAAAKRGDIEDLVSALGTLQPLQYVDVGTQVSGQLQKIMVDYGAEVKQGDLLAQIDPTVYQAKVAGDEAQLLSLKAQVAEKEAQRVLAEQQLRRQKALMVSRATSEDLLESADANLQAIVAQGDALRAQIKQIESNLKADQANLGYTKIYAPMAGTVVDIIARQGQTLNANQQAPIILRIADLSTMTVWTQVSEADVAKLKIGMAAYFTTLGKPDRRRPGALRQILPTPQVVNNVVLYNALFDVANPDRDLLPQMSAQVFFSVAAARAVVVVPVEALRRGARGIDGGGGATVRVLVDGKPQDRPVSVGVTNRALAEITAGLKEGEIVVLPSAGAAGASGAGQVPRVGPRL